jgi:hypothetical protein
LGLLAVITLEVVPFRTSALFPVLLPFLNASWKLHSVMVFSAVCDSASITLVVSQWQYLQLGKQRAKQASKGPSKVCIVLWVREKSHVVFGHKFPGEKGNVRGCVAVIQQPVLLLPKFRAKSSHIFKQSP